MAQYSKHEHDLKIISSQVEAFRKNYSSRVLDNFSYFAFQKHKNYLIEKIKKSSLQENVKKNYEKELEAVCSTVHKKHETKNTEKIEKTSKLEESIKITEPLKEMNETPPTSEQKPIQEQLLGQKQEQLKPYKPKGQGKARKNYYLLLNNIIELKDYCSKFDSVDSNSKFSAKEFYKKLNEIENFFLYEQLHGDDSRHLWQKYKEIRDKTKEALKKESEKARKTIEAIVEEGIKAIDNGNIQEAKQTLFKAFGLFKSLKISREDRELCNEKIDALKLKINSQNELYKNELNKYFSQAQELLKEAQTGNFYNVFDKILDFKIELKMSPIGAKDYKKIMKILDNARAFALSRKAEEKKEREKNKAEKLIRQLTVINEDRKNIISETEKEIVNLRATRPFDPKIVEKEAFIKELKKEIEKTEKDIEKLKTKPINSGEED